MRKELQALCCSQCSSVPTEQLVCQVFFFLSSGKNPIYFSIPPLAKGGEKMKKISLILTAVVVTALLMTTLHEATFGQEEERPTCDPYLAEAERISGWCLRRPRSSNPESSSSIDEAALRLAEQIAGQPLRHVEE